MTTFGSECETRCANGFYAASGSGVATFKCEVTPYGGSWLQRGYLFFESALLCTRCPAIENCLVSSCATGTDVICAECEAGYAVRPDEEPIRCLPLPFPDPPISHSIVTERSAVAAVFVGTVTAAEFDGQSMATGSVPDISLPDLSIDPCNRTSKYPTAECPPHWTMLANWTSIEVGGCYGAGGVISEGFPFAQVNCIYNCKAFATCVTSQ